MKAGCFILTIIMFFGVWPSAQTQTTLPETVLASYSEVYSHGAGDSRARATAPQAVPGLTHDEARALEEALQLEGSPAGNSFFVLFGNPVRIRRLSVSPDANSSYSLNIPPKTKIVCVFASRGGVLNFSSVQNTSHDWVIISGIYDGTGLVFDRPAKKELASCR